MENNKLFWYSINLIFGIFGVHFFFTNKIELAFIQFTLGICSLIILFNTFVLRLDVPQYISFGWGVILIANLTLLMISITQPLIDAKNNQDN
jgi:hypothetical protein